MWLRFVQVIVTSRDDPERKVIFQDHKIDFEVRSTIGWAADTATITLTNLSVDEMKFLQTKEFGELDVELRAGYLDKYDYGGIDGSTAPNSVQVRPTLDGSTSSQIRATDTIFSGVITNAIGFKQVPEAIFTMFCLSKAAQNGTVFVQMKDIPNGATLWDAIQSMCADYGYGTISQFGLREDDLTVKLPLGRTFQDTFVNEFTQLLGEYNLDFRITTSEIQIFPDTYGDKSAVTRMAKDREPIKLNVNQVIGNPISGITNFRLNTFLDSSIQPGMVLDVTPLVGDEILVNGIINVQGDDQVLNYDQSVFRWAMSDFYLIMDVVHQGGTHVQTFVTSLSCIIGGASAMGGNEASWQDMYARTGMGS